MLVLSDDTEKASSDYFQSFHIPSKQYWSLQPEKPLEEVTFIAGFQSGYVNAARAGTQQAFLEFSRQRGGFCMCVYVSAKVHVCETDCAGATDLMTLIGAAGELLSLARLWPVALCFYILMTGCNDDNDICIVNGTPYGHKNPTAWKSGR